MLFKQNEMDLNTYIRDIANFPKEGILFKDITPLLNSAEATAFCLNQMLAPVQNIAIDRVVGVESRGFFFAMLLAQKLNAGFVPVRKPGKLPFTTIREKYALEYGTDTLEMHIDGIKPGEKVLIHDDVLATGGTIEAVIKMVEKLGGEIVHINFLIELGFLNGADKIKGYAHHAVLRY